MNNQYWLEKINKAFELGEKGNTSNVEWWEFLDGIQNDIDYEKYHQQEE